VVIEAAPVSTGRDARVTEAGRYRFFAGWRSDPSSSTRRGALNDLQFTGDDFFIDKTWQHRGWKCPLWPWTSESAFGRARWMARASLVQADRGALPLKRSFS